MIKKISISNLTGILKTNKREFLLLFILILFALPSVWYLFLPGFPATDDGGWMIIRFSAFYQALREGQFPVRFLGRLNYGYGYPVANFLYPGFMYIAVPIKLAGLTFINTIKIELALSVIASGVFSFLWIRRLFGLKEAFLAGLFYIYLPYHLYDLSKRGSVGEILALAIAPFILWGVERKSVLITALGIFLLILSHNTLALLFLIFIFFYTAVRVYEADKPKKIFSQYFVAVGLGILAASFFWFPAIAESGLTVFGRTKVSDFSKYFSDPMLIGPETILVLLAGLYYLIKEKKLIKKNILPAIIILSGLFSIFLASSFSEQFWKFLPVSFIQFPFRFLAPALLASTYSFAFLISKITEKFKAPLGILFIILTLLLSFRFIYPVNTNKENDSFYSTNESTTTVLDEYMPIFVKQKPEEHFSQKVLLESGEGELSNIFYNSQKLSFNFDSDSPSVVRINTIYYPGWRAFSNGSEKAIYYDNVEGIMTIKLEEGSQKVVLMFGETPVRIVADIVSVFSLAILTLYSFRNRIAKKIGFSFSWI